MAVCQSTSARTGDGAGPRRGADDEQALAVVGHVEVAQTRHDAPSGRVQTPMASHRAAP